MAARIQIFAEDEDEAKAWIAVLRSLGLQILGPASRSITRDGTWLVRARVAEQEQQPRSRAS